MKDSEKQGLYQKIGTKVIHKKYGKGRITGSDSPWKSENKVSAGLCTGNAGNFYK